MVGEESGLFVLSLNCTVGSIIMFILNLIDRDGSGLHRARDKSTIKRLQMYAKGGKVTR